MNQITRFCHRAAAYLLICLVLLTCLQVALAAAAETDDSSLFMEAFTAFQGKDYLLSIEKLDRLEQLFPDSPLRDVALLLAARAQHRAGNNDAAALSVNQFSKEFGNGPLAASVEADLLTLGKRKQSGEKLSPNKQLHAAALKVRHEQQARERAAAMKAEQERLARERVEQERIAREKAELERRERERLAALKAARDAVRFELESDAGLPVLETGSAAVVPFQLVNQGKESEEFSLEALLPAGVEGTITTQENRAQPVQKLTLQPRQRAALQVTFAMPPDRVDGARLSMTVTATSTKFNDLSKKRELTAVAAAPLLRVVSRLQEKAALAGLAASYKVTLLNVGSRPAKEIDLKITLPKPLKLVDAGGNGCWLENEQQAACRIAQLPQGQLTDRILKVETRNDAAAETVRGTVEVLQTVLQLKESFPGAAFAITKKP